MNIKWRKIFNQNDNNLIIILLREVMAFFFRRNKTIVVIFARWYEHKNHLLTSHRYRIIFIHTLFCIIGTHALSSSLYKLYLFLISFRLIFLFTYDFSFHFWLVSSFFFPPEFFLSHDLFFFIFYFCVLFFFSVLHFNLERRDLFSCAFISTLFLSTVSLSISLCEQSKVYIDMKNKRKNTIYFAYKLVKL